MAASWNLWWHTVNSGPAHKILVLITLAFYHYLKKPAQLHSGTLGLV